MIDDDVERYLQLALETAGMAVWHSRLVDTVVVDADVFWRDTGASMIGLPPVPITQPFRDFLAAVHAEDQAYVVTTMQTAVDHRRGYEIEYRVTWPDKTVHWLSARAQVCLSVDDAALNTFGIVWDVTERVIAHGAAARQKERIEKTLASIGDAVVMIDADGNTEYLNRIAEQLTGWSCEEAVGQPIQSVFDVIDERDNRSFENPALKCLRLGESVGVSTRSQLISRTGHRFAIEERVAPIRGNDGPTSGAVIVFHDVSHERKLREEMSWHATHDALTGLINRREFELQVGEALCSAKHESHVHALLFMDLDQFKIVNDTCGHAAGDALLKTLTSMLQQQMRHADCLSRLGGDEFGVLLRHCPAEQAAGIAEQVRSVVHAFRFVWDARIFDVGISIGLVTITQDSKSLPEILSAADQACYVAKERGRNCVCVYKETDVAVTRRYGETLWVSRIHEALAKGHFQLHAQPIVSLRGGTHEHSEILIRMKCGDGSLVLPGAFIPAAERYGVVALIDRWVIDNVFRTLRDHGAVAPTGAMAIPTKLTGMYSINLSGVSLNDISLRQYISEKLLEYSICPTQICFEITETAVISNMGNAQRFIRELRQIGCRFSLDDFGSGLSSVAYLRSLPVDYLKIDGGSSRTSPPTP